jgi:hypothetical protein
MVSDRLRRSAERNAEKAFNSSDQKLLRSIDTGGAFEPAGTVAAHEAAADPHPGYLTTTEGNAAYAPLSHVGGSGAAHANASGSSAGFMSAADFTKLAGVAAGATVNATDAALRDRSTHTGTQAASTISDFASAARAQTEAELVAGTNITITPSGSGATRQLTIAAAGGGADPWTYIKLGADFATSSATAVDVTGLSFSPDVLSTYVVEAHLRVRTATATVGPRPGIAWPLSGVTDGVGDIQMTSAAGTNVFQNGSSAAAILAPVGGVPNTTASWPAYVRASFTTGASVSGNFRIQLASETAGTTVTMKADSFIRYREI